MPTLNPSRMRLTLILALLGPTLALFAQETAREQIGVVLGKAVFRDQLPTGDDADLAAELHRLLSVPLLEDYKARNRAEVVLTEHELDFALTHFRKQHDEEMKREGQNLRRELTETQERLKQADLSDDERRRLRGRLAALEFRMQPPERHLAEYMAAHSKFQRHLYVRFGGGRVLFQQAGLEAFDAMHEFLRQQEKAGAFRIDDDKLRQQFYAYWTTMDHGPFLTSDKEQIDEFLNPPWLPPADAQPASRPRDGD